MMAEFGSLEDWGLQVVIGVSGSIDDPNSCYGLLDIPKNDHHNTFSNFTDLFETATMLDELEELYKPFYSISHTPPAQNSPAGPTIPSFSTSVCKEMKEEPDQEIEEKLTHADQPPPATAASTYMPKYKRRKNQHKRVVLQVTAKDLSSDMWAWRKYGQKPIKGSPYPRSYYRCSSSKGCLARKQVEQSCRDPSIFIITYTAEHNHSQPTRKNALAGTVRQKFSTPKNPACSNSKAAEEGNSGRCLSSPTIALSPETPLLAEEENFQGRNIEIETKDENDGQMVDVLSHNNKIFFPEFMFDDDFFSGFGYVNGFMPEFGGGHCSTEIVSSESDLSQLIYEYYSARKNR